MNALFVTGSQYNSFKPISVFIDKFETQWALLQQLSTSGTTSYRQILNQFFTCDEAKQDALLSMLIPHMSNIIDNISTKPMMSYAEAKQRLILLLFSSEQTPSTQDSALITVSKKT